MNLVLFGLHFSSFLKGIFSAVRVYYSLYYSLYYYVEVSFMGGGNNPSYPL